MTWSTAETKNRMLPVAIATFFILSLFSLPAFKRDGHFLFGDPYGIKIWEEEVKKFLLQIGFAPRQ
jgi:hypothetical protein